MNNTLKEIALKLRIKELEKKRKQADQNVDHFQRLYDQIGREIEKAEGELWDIEEAKKQELCQKAIN